MLEPYYVSDDLKDVPVAAIQSVQKQSVGWLNAPGYDLTTDVKADNSRLRDALLRGADALVLHVSPEVGSNDGSLSRLLNGIKLSESPVFFRLVTEVNAGFADQTAFIQALKMVAPYQLKGGMLIESDQHTAEVTRVTADSPQFRTVCVNSHGFHNAGATATQELAFILGRLADVYDQLTGAGFTARQLMDKTILSISVGTSYFPEIAKLRALRVLVARFFRCYAETDAASEQLPQPYVHCQTSTFYDAAVSPYTNLLRATTEAMAAVVGGCDALTVRPYDGVTNTQTDREFSDRIARNISILLSEESYLDKVTDPSAGSYYIETLTHSLAESAWSLFLRVEEKGGFSRAYADGFIQQEIEAAWQDKVEAVRKGKVLVGVTAFRTDPETAPATDEKVLVEPVADLLPNRRLAEEFEHVTSSL